MSSLKLAIVWLSVVFASPAWAQDSLFPVIDRRPRLAIPSRHRKDARREQDPSGLLDHGELDLR